MSRNRKQQDPSTSDAAAALAAAWDAANPEHAPTPTPEEAPVTSPAPRAAREPRAPRTHNARGIRIARGLPCLCGCGLPTHTPDARFLSGHDAILRKRVLVKGEPLPDLVVPFFTDGETIGGMRLTDPTDPTTIVDVKRPGGWA